jgi:hypothetical protein
VEKTLRSGIFLECPNKKKTAEEETPKKRGKKVVEAAVTVECSYSKRIGDAPAAPTAETHGPVPEKDAAEPAAKAAVKTPAKAVAKVAAKAPTPKATAKKSTKKK